MPAPEILFACDMLIVRPLTLGADLPLIESLCRRCKDYYLKFHGEPADDQEARKIFEETPSRLTAADKLILGIFDSADQCLGVIEVLRGYRQPGDWYIGLMMLEPGARGSGRGSALHSAFVQWARTQGAERLLLAVLEENVLASVFWQAQGYRLLKTFPPRVIGRKTQVLEEMELLL